MPSPMQGKRVVVVGAGKTAHDVGVVVSKVAASTTLVARRGHWMAPQTVLGEPQQLQCRCSMLQITQQRS
jgi:cation diffusion facilitator CzcD-associated flavoprotein CzcO